jgi:hypothetical protein
VGINNKKFVLFDKNIKVVLKKEKKLIMEESKTFSLKIQKLILRNGNRKEKRDVKIGFIIIEIGFIGKFEK